jgi:hypothetical protein
LKSQCSGTVPEFATGRTGAINQIVDPVAGGWAVASRDDRTESLKAAASYFKAGEAKLELAQAHAWGDTVVLVMTERQHGQVGGLPDQDWSLRVTQRLSLVY